MLAICGLEQGPPLSQRRSSGSALRTGRLLAVLL